ncbi:hypothetical protein ACWKWZ_27320 [Metapseudomonas otitidis]
MALNKNFLLLVLFIQGCTYDKFSVRNEAEAAKYDPASMARVRVFSSPEMIASYYPGSSCLEVGGVGSKKDIPLREYRGGEKYIFGRKADLLGMRAEDYKNTTIGIPLSETTEELMKDRSAYNEVVVPAGVSSVFSIFYSLRDEHVNSSCFPPRVSISPRAGADYEVRLVFESKSWGQSWCRLSIKELIGDGAVKKTAEVNSEVCR